MLFPKAILEAEWAVDAPFREAMAIKRERVAAGALTTGTARDQAARSQMVSGPLPALYVTWDNCAVGTKLSWPVPSWVLRAAGTIARPS
jgi:hypothetical protein